MDLWILQKRPAGLLVPCERMQLRDEARNQGTGLEAIAPEDIDRIVSGTGTHSIRCSGTKASRCAATRYRLSQKLHQPGHHTPTRKYRQPARTRSTRLRGLQCAGISG